MVFGNKGEDSGTGVAFTRNPATGETGRLRRLPDQRPGRGRRGRHPRHRAARRHGRRTSPSCHTQLLENMANLENHYRDMCDIEFTIEQGKLYMLQTRVGKRTAAAALRMAAEMVEEGLIEPKEAVLRVQPAQLDQLLHPQFDPKADVQGHRQGPQRLARRGGRRRLLHRRRRRGARPGGGEGHPRPPRDQPRRPPRHDRRRGHPHVPGRARQPRRRRRPRHGQAGHLRRRGGQDRPQGQAVQGRRRCRQGRRHHLHLRHHRRDRPGRGAGGHPRADRALRHRPRLRRPVPPPQGPHQRRHPGGLGPGPRRSAPRASACAAPSTCSSARTGWPSSGG